MINCLKHRREECWAAADGSSRQHLISRLFFSSFSSFRFAFLWGCVGGWRSDDILRTPRIFIINFNFMSFWGRFHRDVFMMNVTDCYQIAKVKHKLNVQFNWEKQFQENFTIVNKRIFPEHFHSQSQHQHVQQLCRVSLYCFLFFSTAQAFSYS